MTASRTLSTPRAVHDRRALASRGAPRVHHSCGGGVDDRSVRTDGCRSAVRRIHASADHNAVASDGTPLVQRYSLSIFALGSSVAFDTVDLGKPAPSAGVIRVNFIQLLHTQPTPNVVFEARVTAVGPGGSTASSVSNGFSFQATARRVRRRSTRPANRLDPEPLPAALASPPAPVARGPRPRTPAG